MRRGGKHVKGAAAAAYAFVTRVSPASGCDVLIVSSALLWGVQALSALPDSACRKYSYSGLHLNSPNHPRGLSSHGALLLATAHLAPGTGFSDAIVPGRAPPSCSLIGLLPLLLRLPPSGGLWAKERETHQEPRDLRSSSPEGPTASVGDGRGRGQEPGSSHWGGGLWGSGLGSHLKVWLGEEALWRPLLLATQTSSQGFVSSWHISRLPREWVIQEGKGHKPSVTQSWKCHTVTGARSVSPGHIPRKEGYAPSLKAGAPESVQPFPQFLSAHPESSLCFPICSFLLWRHLGSSCILASSPSWICRAHTAGPSLELSTLSPRVWHRSPEAIHTQHCLPSPDILCFGNETHLNRTEMGHVFSLRCPERGASLVLRCLRLCLPRQQVWVRFLI